MEYTSHIEKRMEQRGFTKNMINALCDFGDSEPSTHKIQINKGNIILLCEEIYELEVERKQLCKQMRELNKKG